MCDSRSIVTQSALQETYQTAESRQLGHGVQHQLPGPGGQEPGQAGHLVHWQESHRDDGEEEGQPGVPHLGVPGQPGQLSEPELQQEPGQQRREQPQCDRRGEERSQHVRGEGVIQGELRGGRNWL